MENLPSCVKCGSEYTYENGNVYVCPECSHEWMKGSEDEDVKHERIVKDAYGNILKDGDSVTIIKDVKVKGTSSVLKIGLKVKDIRLIEEVNGHDIDAKVKGIGELRLKSSIVKKSN